MVAVNVRGEVLMLMLMMRELLLQTGQGQKPKQAKSELCVTAVGCANAN